MDKANNSCNLQTDRISKQSRKFSFNVRTIAASFMSSYGSVPFIGVPTTSVRVTFYSHRTTDRL